MQVFVARADLSLSTGIKIISSYPDVPTINRDQHGTDAAVLSLPNEATTFNPDQRQQVLIDNWRTYASQIVNGESQRRILESFSEFMQRNALARVQRDITTLGWDWNTWNATERNVYSTAQTGWQYISTVRTASDAMVANMPVDPTDDNNWPTRIAPIYIPNL